MNLSETQITAIRDLWYKGSYQICNFETRQSYLERRVTIGKLPDNIKPCLSQIIEDYIDQNQKFDSELSYLIHRSDNGRLKTDGRSLKFQLIHWIGSNSDYHLLDFSGWPKGHQYGAIALFETKTQNLTIIASIDNHELEILVEESAILNIFIDYEEWRFSKLTYS